MVGCIDGWDELCENITVKHEENSNDDDDDDVDDDDFDQEGDNQNILSLMSGPGSEEIAFSLFCVGHCWIDYGLLYVLQE